jgi:hypothetical protein
MDTLASGAIKEIADAGSKSDKSPNEQSSQEVVNQSEQEATPIEKKPSSENVIEASSSKNKSPNAGSQKAAAPADQPNALAEESVIRIESQALSRQSGQSDDLNDYFVSTTNYKLFLLALIQYIIGESEINDWMAANATALELENGTIVATSERHPPLISDSFGYGTKWIVSKLTNLVIDMETRSAEDMIAIEKSFQSGTRIMYSNMSDFDSLLLSMLYYKNSMNQASPSDDSRLIMFAGRRLFCTPTFRMYFETELPFSSFSPNILTSTTPISYQLSVENLIDIFQLKIFEVLYPEEFIKRRLLLNCVKECNDKLEGIDKMLKQKWDR